MTSRFTPAGDTRLLALICAGGLVVRVATGWFLPNINHPDETFQYLEQAYRLLTDRGLVPWEYQVGARSWLLAWLIVPAEAVAHAISPHPAVLRGSVILFLSLLSTAVVLAAWRIGRHSGGRRHALFAALLAAFWCEIVYLSTHMLADSISAIPLLAALASGVRGSEASKLEITLSGLLFGLTIVVRPQLAPACGIAMLWIAGVRPSRRWIAMAAGFVLPILLLGVTDWIVWGAPFHSITTYLHVNSGGIADIFGVEPPNWYILREFAIWGLAIGPVLASAALGLRRAPLLAIVALIVLLTFSAVPHKEWRFLYPALPILFTLCGIGTAEATAWLSRRMPHVEARWIVGAAVALWLGLSLLSGVRGSMRPLWQQNASQIRALDLASADPAACGIAVDPPGKWEDTGMVRIRADMRLFGAATADAPGFNYLMVTEGRPVPPDLDALGYRRIACFPKGVCLYRRPGACHPAGGELKAHPSPQVAAQLRALGL